MKIIYQDDTIRDGRKTMYAHLLSNKDVENIVKICFIDFGEIDVRETDLYWSLIKSVSGKECYLHDFQITPSDASFCKKNFNDKYVAYLYHKFGEHYLLQKVEEEYDIASFKKRKYEAERDYEIMKDKSTKALEYFKANYETIMES